MRFEGSVWLAASMLYGGEDRRRLRTLQKLAHETGARLIAVNDALYHQPEQRELQDVVTCIREHTTLAAAGKRLEANAERHLKRPGKWRACFAPRPHAIAETIRFAGRINFSLDQIKQNYPHEPVPPGKTADEHLRDLTEAGLQAPLSGRHAVQGRAHWPMKELRFIAEQEDRALFPHRA